MVQGCVRACKTWRTNSRCWNWDRCALAANKSIVKEKQLQVTGVDIDQGYCERCVQVLREADLSASCSVIHASIDDFVGDIGPFDTIYFSASLMLMPDVVKCLRHVETMLRRGGSICFTQTFEKQQNRFMEFMKPLLKFITTIDFGSVTYFDIFEKCLRDADLEIIDNVLLQDKGAREFRLVIAQPVREIF